MGAVRLAVFTFPDVLPEFSIGESDVGKDLGANVVGRELWNELEYGNDCIALLNYIIFDSV